MLNGTKTWISQRHEGHCFALLSEDQSRGLAALIRGMSLLLARKGPGFTREPQAGETFPATSRIDIAELVLREL